jgi:hypothetical protein
MTAVSTHRLRMPFARLGAALALGAGIACTDPAGPERVQDLPLTPTIATAEDLASARQRWLAAGITHYRFTEQRACFCIATQPVRIEVRRKASPPHHESITSILFENGGQPPLESVQLFHTVDQLFALVQSSIDNDVEILVSYHPTYGYPTSVDIEPSQHPVDGGVLYTVSKFEIVERDS